MSKFLREINRRVGVRGDRGIVAVWTAMLLFVFIGMTAIAVDISRWYVEESRVQKAVDAASLAGSVYMPGNQTTADSVARATLKANGFDPADAARVSALQLSVGDSPSQYKVTLTTPVQNAFATIFGIPTTNITGTAVSDYAAPLAMGSPCNVLGYEWGTTSDTKWASDNCPDNTAKFWANIAGPNTNKARGDAYAAAYCGRSEAATGASTPLDNCNQYRNYTSNLPTGNISNAEYEADGYIFIARTHGTGQQLLTLQGYDMTYQGTKTGDGRAGADLEMRGGGGTAASLWQGSVPAVTEVIVRHPSTNPALPLEGAEICRKTIPANSSTWRGKWVDLCPGFMADGGKDYSIQIKTPLGGGMNQFSLRASYGSDNRNVSIFAQGRMSLYTNDGADNPTFKFVRLDSSSAGRYLEVRFFDLGDVSGTATVRASLLQPDSSAEFTSCTRTDHGRNQSLGSSCSVDLNEETNSGLWTTILVKIPESYRCLDPITGEEGDQSLCWVKVKLTTTDNIMDVTTWSAQLLGDPVRLVK